MINLTSIDANGVRGGDCETAGAGDLPVTSAAAFTDKVRLSTVASHDLAPRGGGNASSKSSKIDRSVPFPNARGAGAASGRI